MFSKATTISYQQYNSFPYFYGQMRLASSQLPNSSHINSTLKLHYSYWQNKISEVTTAHFCQFYHFQSVYRLYFKNSIIQRSVFNRPYFLRHFYSKFFFYLRHTGDTSIRPTQINFGEGQILTYTPRDSTINTVLPFPKMFDLTQVLGR